MKTLGIRASLCSKKLVYIALITVILASCVKDEAIVIDSNDLLNRTEVVPYYNSSSAHLFDYLPPDGVIDETGEAEMRQAGLDMGLPLEEIDAMIDEVSNNDFEQASDASDIFDSDSVEFVVDSEGHTELEVWFKVPKNSTVGKKGPKLKARKYKGVTVLMSRPAKDVNDVTSDSQYDFNKFAISNQTLQSIYNGNTDSLLNDIEMHYFLQ